MSTRSRWIFLVVLAVALLVPAPETHAQIPDEFTNLEVLPQDISRRELMGIMRGYAGALGVRCIHCHVGEDPNDLKSVDFVSDDREAKRVARVMMKMVDKINDELIPATGRDEPRKIDCRTCHHGLSRPESLRDVVAAEIEQHGIDAGTARYRELRDEYHGRDAYDFGPATLNGLAEQLARQQQDTGEALTLIDLNLEFHPESSYTHFLKGGLLAAGGDKEAAAKSIRQALELDPGNSYYQRTLARLSQSD